MAQHFAGLMIDAELKRLIDRGCFQFVQIKGFGFLSNPGITGPGRCEVEEFVRVHIRDVSLRILRRTFCSVVLQILINGILFQNNSAIIHFPGIGHYLFDNVPV